VNGQRKPRRSAPPLDEQRLQELALAYVGRFATTRARLRAYLTRKIRERGWDGAGEPDSGALAERLARQGYVDDAGYALAKAQALTARGYGRRRVDERLRGAGVEEQDAAAAREHSEAEAVAAALRFAERRRLGPFAAARASHPRQREKAIAAMVRAGHGFGLAKAIVGLAPGEAVDPDELAQRAANRQF
jgi:regulatory protein